MPSPTDWPLRASRVNDSVDTYLTVREVAAIARCEHKAVRRAIAAGRLRAFQPANKLLIRKSDVYAWIEAQSAETKGPSPSRGLAPIQPRAARATQAVGSVAELRAIERRR
jgi:excisionase family DNA binding protein